MIKPFSIPFFIGRITICFIVLFIIYIRYGPPNEVEVEMINMILYILILPFVLIPMTITICLILGFPITLNTKISKWWYSNSYIAFIGLIISFILIFFSPNYTDTIKIIQNGTEIIKEVPNDTILIIGWFMTSFFILHFYPIRFLESIKDIIKGKNNKLDWEKDW